MSQQRPRAKRGTVTREKIIDAVLAHVKANPGEEPSMSAIAGQLGIVTMGLYKHVESKQQLMMLAAEKAFAEFPLAIPTDQPLMEQARCWCRQLRQVFVGNPHLVFLVRHNQSLPPAWSDWVQALAGITERLPGDAGQRALALQWFFRAVFGLIYAEILSQPKGRGWMDMFDIPPGAAGFEADALLRSEEEMFELCVDRLVRALEAFSVQPWPVK